MKRDDVGLCHRPRVDPLGRLDLGQRLDPITQGSGTFELHRFGGSHHISGEALLDLSSFAR